MIRSRRIITRPAIAATFSVTHSGTGIEYGWCFTHRDQASATSSDSRKDNKPSSTPDQVHRTLWTGRGLADRRCPWIEESVKHAD